MVEGEGGLAGYALADRNPALLRSTEDKLKLGADEHLVLGDNSKRSLDGRQLGPVKRKSITGKVFYIYAPANRKGWIEYPSFLRNIAEGCGRTGDADFARFLQIAMGSAGELRYQLLLSRDLGFLSSEAHGRLTDNLDTIMKMLATLLKRLRASSQ